MTMNDKIIVKLSLLCTIGSAFFSQKNLNVTDDDIKKLSSLVDRIIKIIEKEGNETV